MTGPQLKALREARNLNQAQLAEFLGDSTPGTVSRWEKGVHAIPQWVEDKMLATAQLTLPLSLLQRLMEYATVHELNFEQLLARAITAFLQPLEALPPHEEPAKESCIGELSAEPKAAEDPATP